MINISKKPGFIAKENSRKNFLYFNQGVFQEKLYDLITRFSPHSVNISRYQILLYGPGRTWTEFTKEMIQPLWTAYRGGNSMILL